MRIYNIKTGEVMQDESIIHVGDNVYYEDKKQGELGKDFYDLEEWDEEEWKSI